MLAGYTKQSAWRLSTARCQKIICRWKITKLCTCSNLLARRCGLTVTHSIRPESATDDQLSVIPGVQSKFMHCDNFTYTVLRSVCALALASLLTHGVLVAHADEATATSNAALELQQAYDKYSSRYDDLDGGAAAEALGFPQLRQKLLEQARGDVLEVAVGTGLNLPYYRWANAAAVLPSQLLTGNAEGDIVRAPSPSARSSSTGFGAETAGGVTSLSTVDLSPGMLLQARRRVVESPALADQPISFRQADVAALPFSESSFDSVVDTFSLCVFPDPQAALKEMARVVRPASDGGRVLLLEHCRSDNPLLAAYQDATAGPVAALGKGCVWNQDVEALAVRAGLMPVARERAAAGTVELLVAVKQ